MYAPQILTAPCHPTGPVDPSRPTQALTSDWSLLDDGEVQIGIWECTPGTFDGTTGGFDEMMCMASGRVTVSPADGPALDIAPGTLWVTPRDWSCTWTVHQTVRKLYVIDNRPGEAAPSAYLTNAHHMGLGTPTARAPLSGTPMEASADLWAHNRLEVGVWECTPGCFTARRDGYDEVMMVLSGSGTLHDDSGVAFPLEPGSVVLTPNGFTGWWEIDETIRKIFAIVRR